MIRCVCAFVFLLAWFGLAWLGLVWFGLVWFGLFVCFFDCLIVCLFAWFVCVCVVICLVVWLAGWLVGWLAGWLVGLYVGALCCVAFCVLSGLSVCLLVLSLALLSSPPLLSSLSACLWCVFGLRGSVPWALRRLLRGAGIVRRAGRCAAGGLPAKRLGRLRCPSNASNVLYFAPPQAAVSMEPRTKLINL